MTDTDKQVWRQTGRQGKVDRHREKKGFLGRPMEEKMVTDGQTRRDR